MEQLPSELWHGPDWFQSRPVNKWSKWPPKLISASLVMLLCITFNTVPENWQKYGLCGHFVPSRSVKTYKYALNKSINIFTITKNDNLKLLLCFILSQAETGRKKLPLGDGRNVHLIFVKCQTKTRKPLCAWIWSTWYAVALGSY